MDDGDQRPARTGTPAMLPDRRGGGTGLAGGTDLHAMSLVVAAVALMRGVPLSWLEGVADDVPVAIRAETGGAGDDIGIDLADGSIVEVQVKKGLGAGPKLWEALEALVDGVSGKLATYGVLLLSTDGSATIREGLAGDVVRLGNGQRDRLSALGETLLDGLEVSNRDVAACAAIRIKTVYLLQHDGADRRAALDGLRWICADPAQAQAALDHLYRAAIGLQTTRGRWTVASLVRLLRAHGVAVRDDETPIGVASGLAKWVGSVSGTFHLPGGGRELPIASMLPARTSLVEGGPSPVREVGAALALYRAGDAGPTLSDHAFDGSWTGRFRRLNVIMAGPGLGKSTLARRIAWENALDGRPVLFAHLGSVAKAMRRGVPFARALFEHALDGAHVAPDDLSKARLSAPVIVADALDETRELVGEAAAGLVRLAAGRLDATVVVTTRTIGYDAPALAAWRHYRLLAPDPKEGDMNLGRMVALGRGLPPDDHGALEQARRALRSTPAKDAIVASPLLLGMAAALIVRDEALPATRPELFRAMLSLFERRDEGVVDIPAPQAARVLDIVGWELSHNPHQDLDTLEQAVRSRLADDLGVPPLAAAPVVATAIRHWERAGVVERLRYGPVGLLAFAHRPFEEFAAARFLVAMPKRRDYLERMVDDPAAAEVVSFAGALGAGDEIAQLFVDRCDRGLRGQLERALTLAGDRDAAVADAKVIVLCETAFEVVASDSDDRLAVGVALAKLASARSAIVVAAARLRVRSNDTLVRLVAAACLARAKPSEFDAASFASLLDDLCARVAPPRPKPVAGIRGARVGRDVDLLDIVAVAALEAQPAEEMLRFVDDHLSGDLFDRFGVQLRIDAVLVAHGLKPKPSIQVGTGASSAAMIAMLAPGDAWRLAANRATIALAKAVVGVGIETSWSRVDSLPQFSALQQLSGIWDSDAGDVYCWTAPYDETSIGAVVRALVSLSRIDPVALATEAAAVIRLIEDEPDRTPFLEGIRSIDVPQPDWSGADLLGLDRVSVLNAFRHGSQWLRHIAGNLLACMPATQEEQFGLLASSEGAELFYASQIVRAADGEAWVDAALARAAAGPNDGVEHLFEALTTLEIPLPAFSSEAIENGLSSGIPIVVGAASRLGLIWIAQGGHIARQAAESGYHATIGRRLQDMPSIERAADTAATRELLIALGVIPASG